MARTTVPPDHSEFGGGPGLIDPEVRKGRVGMTTEQELLEIYATDPGAPPGDPATDPQKVDVNRVGLGGGSA